jgi:hypothetical protein
MLEECGCAIDDAVARDGDEREVVAGTSPPTS